METLLETKKKPYGKFDNFSCHTLREMYLSRPAEIEIWVKGRISTASLETNLRRNLLRDFEYSIPRNQS